jgi:hypothetical protein
MDQQVENQAVVSEQIVAAVVTEIEKFGLTETTLGNLRGGFPKIHFTHCMQDDIHIGKPVVRRPLFNIYLVGKGDHCIHLTSNYEEASGIVLAEIIEDDA